jgi:hypothetical protein
MGKKFKKDIDVSGNITLTGNISGSEIYATSVYVNGSPIQDPVTNAELASISGSLDGKIDTKLDTSLFQAISGNFLTSDDDSLYITNAELASISGSLDGKIDTKLDISLFQSLSGSNSAGRYVDNNVGDGISDFIDVVHGLNTEDVVVSVRDNNTNEIIMSSIEIIDTSTIRLYFTEIPSNSQYSVVVVGYSSISNISSLDESQYVHTTGTESISGDKTFLNDLTVQGTLTVAGSAAGVLVYSEPGGIRNIVKLTQAAYDALTPDNNTFYIIVG